MRNEKATGSCRKGSGYAQVIGFSKQSFQQSGGIDRPSEAYCAKLSGMLSEERPKGSIIER